MVLEKVVKVPGNFHRLIAWELLSQGIFLWNLNGFLHLSRKLLPTVPNAAVLAVLDGTQVDHHSALPQPILHLLLTPEILFLVSTQEDTTLQAYAISEISCHGHSNDASVLYVSLCGKQESSRDGDTNQNPWLVEFSPPSPMSHFVVTIHTIIFPSNVPFRVWSKNFL